jgi:hypothetical protein
MKDLFKGEDAWHPLRRKEKPIMSPSKVMLRRRSGTRRSSHASSSRQHSGKHPRRTAHTRGLFPVEWWSSRQFRIFLGIGLATALAALVLNALLGVDLDSKMTNIITKEVDTQFHEVKQGFKEELERQAEQTERTRTR